MWVTWRDRLGHSGHENSSLWGAPVNTYQLYFLGASEHVFRSEEFQAFDDSTAELFAVKNAEVGPIELWCRTRLVKRWPVSWKPSSSAAASADQRAALPLP
jgi:hypothetical protein